MKYTAIALTACAAISASGQAAAQTTDSIPVALPALDVTVSRSPVPAARLPFAITTISPSRQQLAGTMSAGGALRGVAGVQVSDRFNDALGERITIRGAGARAQFGVRGIRIVMDGVPATMPDGQTTLTHLDASAVTSAQVLHGAAAALWGNAAGGVIVMSTTPLSSRLVRGSIEATGDGLLRMRGEAAAEPTDRSIVHARVTTQQFDGYRAHSAASKHLAMLGGRWSGARNHVWINANAAQYDALNPGSLSAVQLDSARTQANPNNVRQQTGEDGTHVQVGAGWTRSIEAGTFELSAFALTRELINPIPPAIIDLERRAGGARASFATAADRTISIVGGVEASMQADDRTNYANMQGVRGATRLDQDERVTYAAPFVQAVAAVHPAIDALLALRYDRYTFRAEDRLTAGDPDDSGERNLAAPTVAAGVRIRHGAASMYGNYATSFQTPTTTELANRADGAGGFNPDLEAERSKSVEAGVDASLGSFT